MGHAPRPLGTADPTRFRRDPNRQRTSAGPPANQGRDMGAPAPTAAPSYSNALTGGEHRDSLGSNMARMFANGVARSGLDHSGTSL